MTSNNKTTVLEPARPGAGEHVNHDYGIISGQAEGRGLQLDAQRALKSKRMQTSQLSKSFAFWSPSLISRRNSFLFQKRAQASLSLSRAEPPSPLYHATQLFREKKHYSNSRLEAFIKYVISASPAETFHFLLVPLCRHCRSSARKNTSWDR